VGSAASFLSGARTALETWSDTVLLPVGGWDLARANVVAISFPRDRYCVILEEIGYCKPAIDIRIIPGARNPPPRRLLNHRIPVVLGHQPPVIARWLL